jgi:cobalt-zinc-cadmium resistance protein CzcA
VRAHSEVVSVISQVGRPDDGTDVSGFNNVELFAPLRPFGEWKRGLDKGKLTEILSGELAEAFPGVIFNFSQAIADNLEEAVSGVKGENSVKVFGPDVKENEALGDKVADEMEKVRGVHDLGVFRSLGQPTIRITTDRVRAARYGLNTGDVEAVIQAAVGGQAATQVYEGERKFDLVVRLQEPFRRSTEAIRRIPLFAPDGSQVALGEVADIAEESGPAVIYREDGRRYTPVKFSVRGRDLQSTVGESQARIDAAVKLPWGVNLEWAGEINELGDATRRLALVIPITLLVIALLVFLAVRNWVDFALVVFAILLSAAGGFLALVATGENFSVSATMGFVSLFGVAVLSALLIVGRAQQCWAEGNGLEVLMTTLVATLGLLPAAVSRGIGSQTQRPLAIVVIGGSLALAFLTRAFLPPLLVILRSRRPPAR